MHLPPRLMPWTTARWRPIATVTKTGFAVRSSNTVLLSRRNLLLIVAGVLIAVLALLVVRWVAGGGDDAPAISHAQRPMRAVEVTRHLAPPVAEAGAGLAAIGPQLSSTPEAANDVVFLTVAAAYGRCMPAHAHELGAMAARARLPVLAGLAEVVGPRSASRATLLAGIRELAARVPC